MDKNGKIMQKSMFALLLFAAPLAAQRTAGNLKTFSPRFEIFKLPGNLPGTNSNNNVQCIVQDSTGFLWFGSQGGLLRYDGKHVKIYRHDPLDSNSLAGNHVEWICSGKNGLLWLAAGPAVSSFDPKTERFTHYRHDPDNPESISGDGADVILEDRNGFLWFGSKGLNRLDPKTGRFKRFLYREDDPRSLSCDIVRSLYEDKNGVLWVGCGYPFCHPDDPNAMKGGLNRFDPKTESFTRYLHDPNDPHSLSDNRVRAMLEDSRGNFWVGTAGIGLQLLDRQTGKFTRLPFDPAHPEKLAAPTARIAELWMPPEFYHLTFISEDQNGWVWMGAFGGGLNVYDPNTNTQRHFEMAAGMTDSLQSNVAWNFCQTKDGTIWICSGDAGGIVYRIKSAARLFPYFTYEGFGLPGMGRLPGIFKDTAGDAWMLMKGNVKGVLRFDPVKGVVKSKYDFDPELLLDAEWEQEHEDITSDRHGNIWVSWEQGLYRMHRNQGDRFRPDSVYAPKIPFDRLFPPFFDRNDNCWIATLGDGLYRFSPNREMTHFKHLPGDPGSIGGNRVYQVFEDKEGTIWVHGGSEEGDPENPLFFDRFNPAGGTFTHALPRGEKGAALRSVEDKNGVFWFAAWPYGIRKLNPKTGEYKAFTSANGALITNRMREMVLDKSGKIWMPAIGFILELDPETEQIRTWSAEHGVQLNVVETTLTGACLGPDGQVLLSGDGLVYSFYPDAISKMAIGRPLSACLTGLSVNNQAVVPGPGEEILKRPIWETGEIRLAHDHNIFSLHVATFEYTTTELSRTMFMLENYDRDWRSDLLEGAASYVNVPPGDYVFRVKSSNSMGVWGPETELRITVLPPWWRSWWAYLLYAALISGGLFALYRFQLKRRLEQAETLRLQELDTLKTKLYTNITHEFRTPLTIILGMAEQTKLEIRKSGNSAVEKAMANLDMVIRNGQSLLQLVTRMLDLSKLESGKLALHYRQGNVVNFLKYLTESFHSLAESKGVQIHFLSDINELMMDFDSERLQQVVSNLLSNALKFTPAGGNVYFSVGKDRSNLIIKIKDTGIGISESDLPQIFDRFFQADDSHTHTGDNQTSTGAGIGLALTKELVKLMEGEIAVKSAPGAGTTFTVTLPVWQSAGLQQPATKLEVPMRSALPETEHQPLELNGDAGAEKPYLLLAEDNADVVAYLRSCLAADYRLAVAKNGQETIEMALETIPDLLVSDVMMPRKDGFEVLEALKNDERTSHIPIILLTAKADAQSRLAGLRRGADAYLAKPFQQEELQATLENLLELRRKLQLKYQQNILAAEVVSPVKLAADPEDAFLQNVRAVIEANYTDDDFGLPQLCQKIGMSRSQLFRKMKALTDIAPSDLIRSHRLNKAKTLLERGTVNVAEAAWEVGFKDPSYFSKLYQEEFGVAPSAARR